MAPKHTNRVVQLPAQPASGVAAAPTTFQSYYSLQILAEMVDVGELHDNGIQITIADAKSLRVGQAQRHALTVLMKDGVQLMTLPNCPRTVEVPVQGMLGPNTCNNITQGSSWAWTMIAKANTAAAKKQAADHGMRILCAILEQGFMKVDLTIPKSATRGEITIASQLSSDRVHITRHFNRVSGAMNAQTTQAIKESLNIHIACANNVPPATKKILQTYISKYASIITMSSCAPNTSMKDSLPDVVNMSVPATKGKRPRKTMPVQESIAKRPARR